MYKNFILTESEKEQILNMHKDKGYGKKLREGDDEKYFARHGEGNIAWTGSSNKTYGDLPDGDYDDETYDDFDSLHSTHPEFHSHYTGSGNVELAKGMFDKYKRSQGPLLVKRRRIQNDQPLSESFDDYKMSAPRSKSISKISSKLNSTPAGFGKGKPWTDNPKYQTDKEKHIQNLDKERNSDNRSFGGSYLEKNTKQREKDYEEYEKLRIKKQQSRVLSIFSLIGEVNGKIKIKDLIEKGELDSNTVNSIIDEIDKNKSLVVGFYSSYEKDGAQEKIDSYIRKGILDSDIVKYIISKLPNS